MSNFSRARTRKFLYQMLYASTFSKVEWDSFRESFFSWIFESNIDEEYLKTMYDLIIENEEFLIDIIKTYAPKFDIENMDLSYILPILIWATEILILPEEIPVKVSINEAVEISKVYWDDSSRKMVNWVLNKVYTDVISLQEKHKSFSPKEDAKKFFKK